MKALQLINCTDIQPAYKLKQILNDNVYIM